MAIGQMLRDNNPTSFLAMMQLRKKLENMRNDDNYTAIDSMLNKLTPTKKRGGHKTVDLDEQGNPIESTRGFTPIKGGEAPTQGKFMESLQEAEKYGLDVPMKEASTVATDFAKRNKVEKLSAKESVQAQKLGNLFSNLGYNYDPNKKPGDNIADQANAILKEHGAESEFYQEFLHGAEGISKGRSDGLTKASLLMKINTQNAFNEIGFEYNSYISSIANIENYLKSTIKKYGKGSEEDKKAKSIAEKLLKKDETDKSLDKLDDLYVNWDEYGADSTKGQAEWNKARRRIDKLPTEAKEEQIVRFGGEKIGTQDGKPVYKMPDGSGYKVD